MPIKKIFGNKDAGSMLSKSEEELFDGLSQHIKQKEASPGKVPGKKPQAEPKKDMPNPGAELEGGLSRRIKRKTPPKRSVGTRLAAHAKGKTASTIAKEEARNLKQISEKLDQKILESGIHTLENVEKNVNETLGIDVDVEDLPDDAEQLLILSVRLMRAAKGFTMRKKLREALFCYEKAQVLFDRVLELDPKRTTTREMQKLVKRFIRILKKRI